MIGGLIYGVGGAIQALIGLRFLFLLLGANPLNGFVNFIYDWSAPLVAPFAGIFGQNIAIAGPGVVVTSIFDWTALIAMVVYAIIFGLLGHIFTRKNA